MSPKIENITPLATLPERPGDLPERKGDLDAAGPGVGNYNATLDGVPAPFRERAQALLDAHRELLMAADGRRVRVTRVLVYEGSRDWILRQMGSSLSPGVRHLPGDATITVLDGGLEVLGTPEEPTS